MELFALAKSELLNSNADRHHPFRYFSLGTISDYPEVRMVVKRKVEQDLTLTFFTDTRSPKVKQIQQNGRVSALFYHPEKKLQIRMNGEAQLLAAEEVTLQQFLRQIKQSTSLKDYMTVNAPGSALEEEAKVLFGSQVHFSAITIKPVYIDVLQLGIEGHLRSAYSLVEGSWSELKMVP
ncbi:MAG: pyridoxamine 5'-phosphate oxidase family protein [Saprospiraceae bacterium]